MITNSSQFENEKCILSKSEQNGKIVFVLLLSFEHTGAFRFVNIPLLCKGIYGKHIHFIKIWPKQFIQSNINCLLNGKQRKCARLNVDVISHSN